MIKYFLTNNKDHVLSMLRLATKMEFKLLITLLILLVPLPNIGQKSSWHFLQSNAACKNVEFTTSGSSIGTDYPKPINPATGTGFTEYYSTNVQRDIDGKLLFYVICTLNKVYFYDRNNELLKERNDLSQHFSISGTSREISIINVDIGVKYHIIVAGKIIEYSLVDNLLTDLAQQTGAVYSSFGSGTNQNYYDCVYAVKPWYYGNTESGGGCLAGYYLYSLTANEVGKSNREIKMIKFERQNSKGAKNVFSEKMFNISSLLINIKYFITEMDINSEGTKLAVAGNQKIAIFDIANNGDLFNIIDYDFTAGLAAGERRHCAGLEFQSNILYFSIFNPYNSTLTDDKVYAWDFENNTTSVISSSNSFGHSVIEKSKSGKIILAKSDGLFYINGNTISTLHSFNITANIGLYNNYVSSSGNFSIYNINDQVDGFKNEFIDLNTVVWSYKFAEGYRNWNNSSHGFTAAGQGKVIVLSDITLNKRFTWVNLTDMNIEFYTDAVLRVYPGANLNLYGTKLKGVDCGLMWKGVELTGANTNNNNKITMQKSTNGLFSQISDAYNGIKSVVSTNILTVTDGSKFIANETDINITNGNINNITIQNSIFDGSAKLKDFSRGELYQMDGELIGYARTSSHIVATNSNIKIGSVSALANKFTFAKYAIRTINSSAEIDNNEISNTLDIGIWCNGTGSNTNIIKIRNSTISDIKVSPWKAIGVKIENGIKETTIQRNNFFKIGRQAIDYTQNYKGILTIGHVTSSAERNNFTECGESNIFCYDNSIKTASSNEGIIEIGANSIQNPYDPWAKGITISEPILPNSPSYKKLRIQGNSIGDLNYFSNDIKLFNIRGRNPMLPVFTGNTANLFNINSSINGNYLKYSYFLHPGYANGIDAQNSSRLNYMGNTISCAEYGVWEPMGIRLSEGDQSLIWGNTVIGGSGMQLTGNGIFSNYYCNQFQNHVNGIQLAYNILRNSASCNSAHNDLLIHAHDFNNSIRGRANSFTSLFSWGSDINFYNNKFDRNMWDFTNNTVPRITFLTTLGKPSCGITHNQNRFNDCNNTGNGGGGGNGGSNGLSDTIVYSDLSGIDKWKLEYSIAKDKKAGNSTQHCYTSNLNSLASIEDAFHSGDLNSAGNLLASFQPNNIIETDFKTVYTIWLAYKNNFPSLTEGSNSFIIDTVTLDSVPVLDTIIIENNFTTFKTNNRLTDIQKNLLQQIASKDAILDNPAAYPARAILYGVEHIEINNPILPFFPNVLIKATGCGNISGVAKLYDMNGVYTGISTNDNGMSEYFFDGGVLKNLDQNMQYYFEIELNNSVILNSPTTSIINLAYASPNNLQCNGGNFLKLSSNTVNRIKIMPNPTTSKCKFQNLPANSTVLITDANGRYLKNDALLNKNEIDFSNYRNGIYFVQVKVNGKIVFNDKIIVSK